MTSERYLRALARSWYIVVITLLAGGGGAYLAYRQQTPLYRTSVQLVVSSGGTSKAPGDQALARSLAAQRAQAFAETAPTRPAVQAAARAAGRTAANAAVSASADSSAQSPFFTVVVSDTSAVDAQAIAAHFAETLPAVAARLQGADLASVTVRNVSTPAPPGAPYTPVLRRDLLLGLAAGLVLGVAVAFVREALDRGVRTADDVADTAGSVSLGIVPDTAPKSRLPARTDPDGLRAEAYRQIRTSVLNARVRKLTTLAVTSAVEGEGKTSVAANLAVVFARAGHSVALVDADLRRPAVATTFGIHPQAGLVDVLRRGASLDDALVAQDERLVVLGAGADTRQASELLGSPEMEQLLAELIARYEYVIIDTPPLLPVTDASVVAALVDGVVLVARLGRTSRTQIRRARAAIDRVQARLIGVVPNRAGRSVGREYGYAGRYAASGRRAGEDALDRLEGGPAESRDQPG